MIQPIDLGRWVIGVFVIALCIVFQGYGWTIVILCCLLVISEVQQFVTRIHSQAIKELYEENSDIHRLLLDLIPPEKKGG